jgi:hypothetical protein
LIRILQPGDFAIGGVVVELAHGADLEIAGLFEK